MTELTPEVLRIDEKSIDKAAKVVISGRLIVFPTDTVYGLGCDPFDEAAVSRVFEAKRREAKPMPVLCGSLEQASRLVRLSNLGEELAREFWPGALTIVAPLAMKVPLALHAGTGSLGVRVPAHPDCLSLVLASGGYLVGTSANLSGSPPAATADEAARQVGDYVDLILDGGRLDGTSSTVVRVDGDGVALLRSGPVRVPDEMMRRRTS